MDMKMAGVAEPTVTRELRRVFTLKASPQPGMKIGVCNLLFTIVAADSFKLSVCIHVIHTLKNHSAIRMTKRTRT